MKGQKRKHTSLDMSEERSLEFELIFETSLFSFSFKVDDDTAHSLKSFVEKHKTACSGFTFSIDEIHFSAVIHDLNRFGDEFHKAAVIARSLNLEDKTTVKAKLTVLNRVPIEPVTGNELQRQFEVTAVDIDAGLQIIKHRIDLLVSLTRTGRDCENTFYYKNSSNEMINYPVSSLVGSTGTGKSRLLASCDNLKHTCSDGKIVAVKYASFLRGERNGDHQMPLSDTRLQVALENAKLYLNEFSIERSQYDEIIGAFSKYLLEADQSVTDQECQFLVLLIDEAGYLVDNSDGILFRCFRRAIDMTWRENYGKGRRVVAIFAGTSTALTNFVHDHSDADYRPVHGSDFAVKLTNPNSRTLEPLFPPSYTAAFLIAIKAATGDSYPSWAAAACRPLWYAYMAVSRERHTMAGSVDEAQALEAFDKLCHTKLSRHIKCIDDALLHTAVPTIIGHSKATRDLVASKMFIPSPFHVRAPIDPIISRFCFRQLREENSAQFWGTLVAKNSLTATMLALPGPRGFMSESHVASSILYSLATYFLPDTVPELDWPLPGLVHVQKKIRANRRSAVDLSLDGRVKITGIRLSVRQFVDRASVSEGDVENGYFFRVGFMNAVSSGWDILIPARVKYDDGTSKIVGLQIQIKTSVTSVALDVRHMTSGFTFSRVDDIFVCLVLQTDVFTAPTNLSCNQDVYYMVPPAGVQPSDVNSSFIDHLWSQLTHLKDAIINCNTHRSDALVIPDREDDPPLTTNTVR